MGASSGVRSLYIRTKATLMSPNDITVHTRRPSRVARIAAFSAVSALSVAGAALVASAPASAAGAASAHDPIGSAPKVTAVAGGLRMTGWAADPDARTKNVRVSAFLDGVKTLGSTVTSLPSAAVTKKYKTGRTPQYNFTVPVPAGKHVVCVVTTNTGPGLRTVNGCVATPLGRPLTAAQRAKQSPVGALTSSYATAKTLRLSGWASDPDLVNRRTLVVAYVDGSPVTTVPTAPYPGKRPVGAGTVSKFDLTLSTASATHIACIWLVNVGFGSNTTLGCKALDNRSPNNRTPALTNAPAINGKVLALATKQIGKPYVWGATGPKSFDCSGLVMWAYGKYGYSTPRVSQDQIKRARLIPQSHARPGDLVFYHDGVGDVYHVGVYLKPGLSVAAIDTDQGVDYQRIWDTTATYGSFTHT
jgi:cell wall-associated NlpC family hydrolase